MALSPLRSISGTKRYTADELAEALRAKAEGLLDDGGGGLVAQVAANILREVARTTPELVRAANPESGSGDQATQDGLGR